MSWLRALVLAALGALAGRTQTGVDALLEELGAASVEDLLASFPLAPSDASDRALKRLADRLQEAGALDRAEALQEERLRGRVERFGADDPRVEPVLSDLGWLALASGRFDEAVLDFEELLARASESHGEGSLQVAVTRINLASAHQGVGQYANVERDYLAALEVVRALEGPDGPTVRVVLHNLSVFLMEVGELSGAERHAREAHRIQLAKQPAATYDDLQLLGLVHTAQGRLELAELELREVRDMARRATEVPDARVAESHRYLGDVLRRRGDLEGAARAYEEALAIYTAVHGERHFNSVRLLHAVGLVAEARGELERARDLMERSIELSAELFEPDHPAHVQRLLNLASLEVKRGEAGRAEALCRSVLGHEPGSGANPAEPLRTADARAHLGEALLALGRPEEAAAELRLADELRAAVLGPDHPDRLDVLLVRAEALEELGELDEAVQVTREGLAIAERQRGRALGDELERARHAEALFHRAFSDRLARLELARGHPRAALTAVEQGRGRLLLDLLQRNEAGLFERAPEERAELSAAIEAEDRARFRLREVERRRELAPDEAQASEAELEDARDALRGASAAVFAELRGAWPEAVPLDAATILARLEPGEVLLSYSFTPRAALLVALAPGRAEPVGGFLLAEGTEAVGLLSARVEELAADLAAGPDRRGALDPSRIAALAEGLLPEEAGALARGARLALVVTDGPLAAVPFELLLTVGAEGARAPELIHAPSATVYLRQRELDRAGRASDEALVHLVALAAPRFEDQNEPDGSAGGIGLVASARSAALFGRRLEPLPATRAEVERTAELFTAQGGGATVLVGPEATRAALEDAAGRASVLHLATHGVHGSEQRPFDAALALTPVEGDSDAFLTLDRLVRAWSGRLAGCELVVLSACDTHRAVRAGAGTLSLAWGFFHAGASSVLATRWRVDDRAAALLVSRFFENRLGARVGVEPMGKAAALREAQTWLREATREDVREAWRAVDRLGAAGTDSTRGAEPGPVSPVTLVDPAARGGLRPYADPYYWGAFVLLGSAE